MKKFHSTVSRRDFMKGLGLVGAGLGAAAATTPVFHDLDEVMAASSAGMKRPWWVKEVDQPTMEVEWKDVKRFAEGNSLRGSKARYLEEAGLTAEYSRRTTFRKERVQQLLTNNTPGYSLRDVALKDSSGKSFLSRASLSFQGPKTVKTPEERGVPRWQGTPEENASMLKHAMRLFGAVLIGFVELDTATTQKLMYSQQPSFGQFIEFEDVDQAYETTDKHVIPNKARWVVIYADPDNPEFIKRDPALINFQHHYHWHPGIQVGVQEFLRALGYQGLGEPVNNGMGIMPAFATMAGVGEMGRHNRLITPEMGSNVGLFLLVTDLPLAPGKPIDSGMFHFCKTCKKCATYCGGGDPDQRALSMEDEPYWDISQNATIPAGGTAGWHISGHRAYFEDSVKCRMWQRLPETCTGSASLCIAVCPFSKYSKAVIHQVVQASIGTTALLDNFLAGMDDFFNYGLKDPATFWDGFRMPIMGIDSTQGLSSY